MINNISRCGNFTSSAIAALMSVSKDKKSFGAPAMTYIAEKNMERRLQRSLSTESNAKPLTWGKLIEKHAFDQMGMEYILSSTETDVHQTIPYWAGSKDAIKHDSGKTVVDIKSPMTLKSFCQLVDPLYNGLEGMEAMKAAMDSHKEAETYYWQIVSNAIINNCRFGELIIYMPYHSELQEIRERAAGVEPEKLSAHYWISMSMDDDLPYIKNGGYYKNLNIIRFEIPQEDKDALTENVLKAGKMLIGNESETKELKSIIAEPKKIQLTKI